MTTEQQRTESYKLKYDTYKHLTTLNSGLVVLIAAFMGRAFTAPHWKPLLGVTIVSLLISSIGSVLAMFSVPESITDESESPLASMVEPISAWGFLVGVITIGLFFARNFIFQ